MECVVFKANWEKTSITHELPNGMVEKMITHAYPHKKLVSYELISGGCANLNIKIQPEHEKHPLILRIYLHDKDAAYRERKLGALLKPTIPVPLSHYIGEYDDYVFAIIEFIPGISLRELLLSDIPHNINMIMYEMGVILSKITKFEFIKSGFFDKDLNIINELTDDFALTFSKECLQNQHVVSSLDSHTIAKITLYFEQYHHLFPNRHEKHLVHADFDPSNILVDKIDNNWKITGILDWEFAFSSSVLHDVANMLRYAHKMPYEYQHAFLKGLTSQNIVLPKDWQITVHLLNLLSLLDCLKRIDSKNRPNQLTDIRELIDHILKELTKIPIKKL